MSKYQTMNDAQAMRRQSMSAIASIAASTLAVSARVTALTLTTSAPARAQAQAAPVASVDAQAILAASDAVRNPGRPFAVDVALIEYRDGRQTDGNTLEVASKADPASGQYRSLIRFVAPLRDANKVMLKNGNDLWFFDPASKASVRISPQQRLLGQAANGDVVTVNLARDYNASLVAEEDTTDGDRKPRHCYKLALAAQNPDVTYARIEMWIDTGNNQPVKARFYADSGRLLKTAYYRRYETQLGGERPTETVIIDGLEPKWVTVMRNSNYRWREIPEAWLQRDFLPQYRPQDGAAGAER